MENFDQELDLSGLNCPLPILKAKKAIKSLVQGNVIHIITTDPGSLKDFEAFAKQTGNELLDAEEGDGEYHFLIRRA